MTATRRMLALLGFLLFAALSAPAATWTTVDVPGARTTEVHGINVRGEMAGTYEDSGGKHGFLLSGGTFTTIDVPQARNTVAWGISDSQPPLTSGYFVDRAGLSHGFVFNGENFTELDFPMATSTFVYGMSNGGVVGVYAREVGPYFGFKWSNGQWSSVHVPGAAATEAFGINNLGDVVGLYADALGQHGFVLSASGEVRKLRVAGAAFGVSDKKVVVGSNSQGYRFNLKNNSLTKLRFPGARATACFGINTAGQVVGDYHNADGVIHGFLRTK